MRMNYKTYPTDYVQELKSQGKRKKSRAFMEYWDDMEHGDFNSLRFYAQSWEVGKSTVQRWQEEFNKESDLFISHWVLKNNRQNNYVKKTMGQQEDKWDTDKTKDFGVCEDGVGQQWDKALNNYNNNTNNFLFDKEYLDFYFVYSRNTNYPGSKPDAYSSFSNRDTSIDIDLLKLSAMKYLNDKAVSKPVGVKKFIANEVYLPYLPKYMRVKSGDEWYEGIYNDKSYELKSRDGALIGVIEPKLLVSLFEKRELIYLTELGVAL